MERGNGSAQVPPVILDSGNNNNVVRVPESGQDMTTDAPSGGGSHRHGASGHAKSAARKKGGQNVEKSMSAKDAGDAAGGESRRQSATLTAFTVQCAQCLKWRKIPTLEQYEKIRARVSQQPFTCADTREWQTDVPITCESPPDLVQDGTLLWAMDRQDIPQPPPNWRRRIVVRGGTSNKFSDVYYHAPCGKVLRSMNDVEKFLSEHSEYGAQGVTPKQFSFASPRPLTGSPVQRSPAGGRPKKGAGPSPANPAGSAAKRALTGAPEGEGGQNGAKRQQHGSGQEQPAPATGPAAAPGVPAGGAGQAPVPALQQTTPDDTGMAYALPQS